MLYLVYNQKGVLDMKVLSFSRFHFGDKVKWDEMFDSVEELVESVKSIDDNFKIKVAKVIHISKVSNVH